MFGEKKESKRKLITFAPYECAAIEEYLEEMALKGWMLDFVSSNSMHFKSIEPKAIKFSVDVFKNMKILEGEDSDSALEYREYCRKAGWNFIDQYKKIQIFYSDDSKAIPIQTDAAEKFNTIVNASISSVLGQFFLVIIFFLFIYEQLSLSLDYIVTDNFAIIAYSIMAIIMTIHFIDIVNFIIWAVKSKHRLKKSRTVLYNTYRSVKRKNMLNVSVTFVMIILYVLCFVVDRNPEKSMSLIIGAICLGAVSLTGGILIKRYIKESNDSGRKKTAVITIISVICVVLCVF